MNASLDVSKTSARDQWERAAPGWDHHTPVIRQWLRTATETMLNMAGVVPGASVLDMAAGAGDQTLDIARRVGPEGTVLATDFSPAIQPSTGSGDRIFELRTYTTTPNNLPLLHARFRDHTMTLFTKHGMTNLFYWKLLPDQQNAENTLVYLLAHKSVEAAKASFDAFRADPDWIAAKKASEEKGGGSLTVPDGVKSVFLKATDYSPTR